MIRRVVISGNKFQVARRMADAGVPFAFIREAGSNTVGKVSIFHLGKLRYYLAQHPDIDARYAKR